MKTRKGISPIIAELLILAIVVGMGTTFYFLATTSVGGYANGFGLLFQQNGKQAQEIYDVQYAQFVSTSTTVAPVTLTNIQGSATPVPFQQQVVFDPSTYSSYESSDLGNIRFCADSACTTYLHAWLEGCTPSCSPTATSATAWVKLTSSITGGGGTLTVYIGFLSMSTDFDANYWGEAPQLSVTYGLYDNGADVFSAYFNGNTPLASFSVYSGYTLAQAAGITGPGGATIDAIEATGYNGQQAVFSYDSAIGNAATVVESSFSSPGSTNTSPYTGADTGTAGLVDSATVAGVSNAISANMGYGVSYFNQDYEVGGAVTTDRNAGGTATANWVYATLTYGGPSATSWSAFIAPQFYSSAGGYAGTVANNPTGSASQLYLGQLSATTASYRITIYYNFMRARAYPPGGVMPATTAGTIIASNSKAVDITIGNVGYVEAEVASVDFFALTAVGGGYPTSAVYTVTTSPPISIVGSNASPYCSVSGDAVVVPVGSFCTVSVPFNWYNGAAYNIVVSTQRGNSVDVQETA